MEREREREKRKRWDIVNRSQFGVEVGDSGGVSSVDRGDLGSDVMHLDGSGIHILTQLICEN